MHTADSRYAWQRLAASTLLSALGSFSMWGVVVIFPALQAEFAATRADVSFSYTSTMVGFGTGVVLLGRMIDARGAFPTLLLATILLVSGCVVAAFAPTLWIFIAAQGALIGFGSAAAFIPLMADISHWFVKRRALAMAISASGNYIGGAIWPKVVDMLTQAHDWRTTYLIVGAVCLVAMLPCCLVLQPRSPAVVAGAPKARAPFSPEQVGLTRTSLQVWLMIAGVGCCIAMSMPQVHIVAYCVDLGYGTARGAEMLSVMTATGIVSRIGSGWIADRIGGMKTVLLGSTLQAMALLAYLISDSLMSIYLVSALFGLVQGGIVPSYGVIVREYYPPHEAGTRMGMTIAATIIGMAVGGWMGGVAFDLTGSYRAAFLNGFAWNVVNGIVVWWLLTRQTRRVGLA